MCVEVRGLKPFEVGLERIINKKNIVILDTNILIPRGFFVYHSRLGVHSDSSVNLMLNLYFQDVDKFRELFRYKKEYTNFLVDKSSNFYITEESKEELLRGEDCFKDRYNRWRESNICSEYHKKNKDVMKSINILCTEMHYLLDILETKGKIIKRNDFDVIIYQKLLDKFKEMKKKVDSTLVKECSNNNHNSEQLFTDENLIATSVYYCDFKNEYVDLVSNDIDILMLAKMYYNGGIQNCGLNIHKLNRENNFKCIFPSLN